MTCDAVFSVDETEVVQRLQQFPQTRYDVLYAVYTNLHDNDVNDIKAYIM